MVGTSGEENPRIDPREFELPETVFSRDIEDQVLHGIIVRTLSEIHGIGLLEGSFLDNLIGRPSRVKGIITTQDPSSQSVKVRIEVKILYGLSIPHKAEEIQAAVVGSITRMTGLRVAEVHVVFRELLPEGDATSQEPPAVEGVGKAVEEEFENEFGS
jgi:uncharacterized alkaline shock family protein YloU